MSADFEFFEKRVRPILVGHCYACHNKSLATSGLRLDNRNGLVSGGSRGAVIVPGDPSSSLLIRAVNHADGAPKMPPSGKLSPVEIADLTAWIQAGAPDPRTEAEPTTAKAHLLKHWAFQPVKPPAVPRGLRQAAWVRNSVDSFVLAALEAKGLRPAAAADKRTLLRRVTFDLTGLPPSPDEIRRFLADQSADAYAKAVERLLESPHYGETGGGIGSIWSDSAKPWAMSSTRKRWKRGDIATT